jgi:glycosyltransferase involved in cell wall biosynthesis
MDAKISVTIGIPTYNRLSYLKEAVASALAQTYRNIEILISQNPHPESRIRNQIVEYCQSLVAQDRRVRYQLRPQNLGPPENFQWIVDNARGDYVILIGDDDRLTRNAIETLVGALAPDVGVAFGRRHIIDSWGRRQPRCVLPENPDPSFFSGWPFTQYEVPAGPLSDPELWAWRQAMGVETSLVRTRDFRRVRYREDIDMPDLEFFIFLARAGSHFVFVAEYVTEYRFHDNSTTGRGFVNFREVFDDLERLPVRAEIEPYKRKLLEMLAFRATSKCLLVGDVDAARRLLASEYCPRAVRNGSKGLLIKLSAALPGDLGPRAFNFLYAIKHGHRYKQSVI